MPLFFKNIFPPFCTHNMFIEFSLLFYFYCYFFILYFVLFHIKNKQKLIWFFWISIFFYKLASRESKIEKWFYKISILKQFSVLWRELNFFTFFSFYLFFENLWLLSSLKYCKLLYIYKNCYRTTSLSLSLSHIHSPISI